MKGQPPKSAQHKALHGNTGRRKKAEPDIVPGAEKISPKIFFSEPGWEIPDWLPDGAKAVWVEQLALVRKQTKIQQAQLPTFAQYCLAQHRVRDYTAILALKGETYETKSGYVRARPEVELREKALNSVRTLADALNLTPKSWINSTGTFAGRQLDMFMNGGAPDPASTAPAESEAQGAPQQDQSQTVGGFLEGRPTLN